MRPAQLLAAVVAVSSLSAAWPDVFNNANALVDVKNVIYGRQDNSESPEPSATPAPKSSSKEEEPKSTGEAKETGKDNEKASGSEKPSETAKETGKQSGKATGSASTRKPKSYGNSVQAGGVQMVTPAPIAGPQYYKVGDFVTFAWNYTSILEPPKAVDILASCSKNQATYTLAVNQSAKETSIVWDTKSYQDSGKTPLLTEMYTLIIYDSESSATAVPKPGYLATFQSFQFGMYLPQKYMDWDEFIKQCSYCSSGAGNLAVNAVVLTSATTIGSFFYFAHSFGLI